MCVGVGGVYVQESDVITGPFKMISYVEAK